MKYHIFFFKISSQAVRQLFKSLYLIKLSQEQLLYKQGDTQVSFFLVLFGKIVLHSKDLGAIGMVKMGDFMGEELLFDKVP
jgi:CRP-like cAMP-binding protein